MADITTTFGALLGSVVTVADTANKALGQVSHLVDATGYGISAFGRVMQALDITSGEMLTNMKQDAISSAARATSERIHKGVRLETELLKSVREYKAQDTEVAADYDRLYIKYAALHGVELETSSTITKLAVAAE